MARASNWGGRALFGLLVAAVAFFYFCPQFFRSGAQPPVAAGVRASMLGIGRVLQLQNQSDQSLLHVHVEAANPATNAHRAYDFDRIDAHDTKELGWREWDWSVDAGETYRVTADGYTLPITFSSAQLGIK